MIETSNAFSRGVTLSGSEGLRAHPRTVNVHLAEHSRGDGPRSGFRVGWRWHPRTRRNQTHIAKALADLRVPVVDLSAHRHLPNVPSSRRITSPSQIWPFNISTDRGFRRFAYCGVERFMWIVRSRRSFRGIGATQQATHAITHEELESFGPDSDAETDAIAKWLDSAAQAGRAVFAGYDASRPSVLRGVQTKGLLRTRDRWRCGCG
jgi:LacI family transcriptional regulator